MMYNRVEAIFNAHKRKAIITGEAQIVVTQKPANGMYVLNGVCLRCFKDRTIGIKTGPKSDKVGKVVMMFCSCQGSNCQTQVEHICTGVTR